MKFIRIKNSLVFENKNIFNKIHFLKKLEIKYKHIECRTTEVVQKSKGKA